MGEVGRSARKRGGASAGKVGGRRRSDGILGDVEGR